MTKENLEIFEKLEKRFPLAKTELNFSSTYQLLVAVILSAQCTDKRVNIVTKELFAVADTPQKIVDLGEENLKKYIFSCGFYNNKAKNIISCSKQILEEYNGEVPNDLAKLQQLAGVGRKTANVVGAVAFGLPTIAVDTHVFRVSNRIGIANAKNVLDTEKQLMKNFDKEKWTKLHHLLIFLGRQICKSQKPQCNECPLEDKCKKKI